MNAPPPNQSAAGLDSRELAAYYDVRYAGDYMAKYPSLETRRVEQLLAEVKRPVRSVVDFGCGQGGWVPSLERAFPGTDVTGLEISAGAIAKARRSLPHHRFLGFERGRAPLPDAESDLVFCYHVLEHVLDLEATVAEIARLLAPGGQACVILPCGNAGSLEERVVRMRTDGADPETGRFFFEDPGHLRRLTTEATRELFLREGLVLVRHWYANQLWGALAWLALIGRGVTRELFRSEGAASRRDRVRLRVLGLVVAGLTPFMQAHSLSRPWGRVRYARGFGERLRWMAALIAKAAASPVGLVLDGLARREWERGRTRPNGSAQYLLFEKR